MDVPPTVQIHSFFYLYGKATVYVHSPWISKRNGGEGRARVRQHLASPALGRQVEPRNLGDPAWTCSSDRHCLNLAGGLQDLGYGLFAAPIDDALQSAHDARIEA